MLMKMNWSLLLTGIFILLQTALGSDKNLREKLNRSLAFLCPDSPDDTNTTTGNHSNLDAANCCGEALYVDKLLDHPPISAYQRCLFPETDPNLVFQTARSFLFVIDPPSNGCISLNVNSTNDPSVLLFSDGRQESNVSGCVDTINATSFLPSFSESTQLLYSSVECARCHGARDAKPWQPMIQCNGVVPLPSERCRVKFIFPGRLEDILHLECFTSRFSKCSRNDNIPVPNGVDLSEDEIKNGCDMSGFPTFTHYTFYRNVFCSMCQSFPTMFPIRECRFPREIRSSSAEIKFTRLMDVRDTTVYVQDDDEVCVNDEVCFKVLCPLDQTRIREGDTTECAMMSIYWQAPEFKVSLQLTFDEEIPVNRSMLVDLISRDLLKSPWPNSWKLFRLYIPYSQDKRLLSENVTLILSDVDDVIERSRDLFLELFLRSERVNSQYLIRQMKNAMDKSWFIHIGGKRVRGKQSFSDFIFRTKGGILDGETKTLAFRQRKIAGSDQTLSPGCSLPAYEFVSIGEHLINVNIYITKLFFCKQVEIPLSDFVIYPGQHPSLYDGILHITTGQMFYDLQFQIVKGDMGTAARVCLDDVVSMFTTINIGKGDHSNTFNVCFLTVVFVHAISMSL